MADTDDIHRWLQGSSWRHVSSSLRPMIERLISEGRAEWVNRWNRARAIPPGKPRNPSQSARLRAENERLRKVLEDIRDNFDHEADAHKYNNGACRCCKAEAALSEGKDT